MMEGNELRDMIFKRTKLKRSELVCPREKSEMTPCVARDGDLAMFEDEVCIGCGVNVVELLEVEKKIKKERSGNES